MTALPRETLEQLANLPTQAEARQQLVELDRLAAEDARIEAAQKKVNTLEHQLDVQAESFNTRLDTLQQTISRVLGDIDRLEGLVTSLANDPVFGLALDLTSAKVASGHLNSRAKMFGYKPGEAPDLQTINDWSKDELNDRLGRHNPLTVLATARSELQAMVLFELRRLSGQRLVIVDPAARPIRHPAPETSNYRSF